MPRKKAPAAPATRLANLPHLPDLVLAGGIRTLAVYVMRGRDIGQPKLCLWMEPATGLVRSVALATPEGTGEANAVAVALDALATACVTPASRPPQSPVAPSAGGGKKKARA